jgi:hypothetical protein
LEAAAARDCLSGTMRDQRGQTSAEYMGMLLVVAVVIGALLATGLGGAIADRAGQAICAIAGQGCATPASASTSEDGLRDRLTALAPLVNNAGGAIDELAAQAQAAIDRRDLDEARRLIERLELYRDLINAGPRGETLSALVAPTAAEFAQLVEQGTIQADDDATNRRYFQIPPEPGQGILVMDLFIPGENAGPLAGDDRGFANPLRDPNLTDTDSRVMVIIDRETGRGVIVQSGSCSMSIGGRSFCNEARPISINGDLGLIENDSENDATGEGINLDVTNNYNVHPDGDGVRIDYESRNCRTSRTCPICRTCRDEGYDTKDARPNRDRRSARGHARRLWRRRPGAPRARGRHAGAHRDAGPGRRQLPRPPAGPRQVRRSRVGLAARRLPRRRLRAPRARLRRGPRAQADRAADPRHAVRSHRRAGARRRGGADLPRLR